jgi:16S rRNA (cytosine967-C5)-methyltransferase
LRARTIRPIKRPVPLSRPPKSKPGAETGLASRKAALTVIAAALDRRSGLEEALGAPAYLALEPRDRAFARALAMTVLRRKGTLDRALQARLQKPPPDEVMALLRLGAAQLLHMEVAGHAAVATTVDLAEQGRGTRPFKALVNAVLRGLGREGPPELAPEAAAPDWLYARWRAAWGEEAARAIAALIPEEPGTDLSLKDPKDAEAVMAALAEGGLEVEALEGGSLRVRHRGDLSAWPGYAEGRWWVQDASAAAPARLLAARPGEDVLDLCAAPGGKTLQLAAAGARVVALDRSAARLERLKQNLARAGLEAETVAADAAHWDDPRSFDAVLLDAPCSATGTFRRHPDVLWATRPGDIVKLAGVQATLLDAAAAKVRPGGRLVYCVCSLEPEEGEAQVDAFLARHPEFRLDPPGALRILPHHRPGGTDGFFAARLAR